MRALVLLLLTACVVSTERPMAGHWEVTHTSMLEFCPTGLETWAELDLGEDDFEARSSQGDVLARGVWTARGQGNDPGVVVILRGSPSSYQVQLSSHDLVHMGGLVAVDLGGGEVCSYAITLEER